MSYSYTLKEITVKDRTVADAIANAKLVCVEPLDLAALRGQSLATAITTKQLNDLVEDIMADNTRIRARRTLA